MSYLSPYKYYHNEDVEPTDINWGSNQYISLTDIVRNFMIAYVGNDKLINNVERFLVRFHAKQAIKELNRDAMREAKAVELTVSDNLKVVLPYDYVNWIRISLYKDGVLRPLEQNIQTNFAVSHLQDNDANILLDEDGNVLLGMSTLDLERISGVGKDMYLGSGSMSGREGYNFEGNWYFDYQIGSRFGMNTETANENPTFQIDRRGGVINFSSFMGDETIVLEYVSDGMENGDDTNVVVNKMFEKYLYAYIEWAILDTKLGIQEYIVRRKLKKQRAEYRNARIAISDIQPGKIMQLLRGRAKWIK